jgi:hypothetical protein
MVSESFGHFIDNRHIARSEDVLIGFNEVARLGEWKHVSGSPNELAIQNYIIGWTAFGECLPIVTLIAQLHLSHFRYIGRFFVIILHKYLFATFAALVMTP